MFVAELALLELATAGALKLANTDPYSHVNLNPRRKCEIFACAPRRLPSRAERIDPLHHVIFLGNDRRKLVLRRECLL